MLRHIPSQDLTEIATWIGGWLSSRSPSQLERIIEQGNLVDILMQDLRHAMGPLGSLAPAMARAAIGPRLMDVIRGMGPEDYRQVLDLLLNSHPDHGLILWQHEDWFVAQMDHLRRALMEG
jgi:hypothetical protein